MRVFPLKGSGAVYSCTSYLVLGDWNRLEDVNALIDTGSDGSIVHQLDRLSTGFGKSPVDVVILTHEHFDHAGGVGLLKRLYGATVYAFKRNPGVDQVLTDGTTLRLGDRTFEVLHTPGHSEDSICLYCAEARVLFSGDTTVRVHAPGGSYSPGFVRSLERLASLGMDTIYPGHDGAVDACDGALLREALDNVRKSTVAEEGSHIARLGTA